MKLSISTVSLTSSLSSATSSMSNTALHIPTWYTISLYTYCSGGNWTTASLPGALDVTYPTYCSPPQPAYYFNPATILGLDTSMLRGDVEYTDALQDYKASALWLFIAYVTALTASCVSALLYLITIIMPHDWRPFDLPLSKLISMLAKGFMSVQVIFNVGAAATASALFYALADVVEEKLGHLGVVAVVGTKMLDFSSTAGFLSVCAAGFWALAGWLCPRKDEVVYWPAREFPWEDVWVSWEEIGIPIGKNGRIALNKGGEVDVESAGGQEREAGKRLLNEEQAALAAKEQPHSQPHWAVHTRPPIPISERVRRRSVEQTCKEWLPRDRRATSISDKERPSQTTTTTKSDDRRSRARTSSMQMKRDSISEECVWMKRPSLPTTRSAERMLKERQLASPKVSPKERSPVPAMLREAVNTPLSIPEDEDEVDVEVVPLAEVETDGDRWEWQEEDIWIDEGRR